MIPYQKEKIENAICFKYLAFLDFTSLKETGEPALGLRYRAMERGPVPIDIYDKRESYSSPLFKFVKGERGSIMIFPGKEPDLDYFSPYEIGLMNRLIEIYARSYIPTRLVSDASHEEIAAWKRTWKTKPNGLIDYALEFGSNSAYVRDGEVPYPEERFLTSRTLDSLEK